MKRSLGFVLVLLTLLLLGCSINDTTETSIAIVETNQDVKEEQQTAEPVSFEPEIEKEPLQYCFYIKDENLFFVDNQGHGPVQLTEHLLAEYYDEVSAKDRESSLKTLAGTLICYYDNRTGMAFFTDHGSSNLYCKDIWNGGNEIHIDDAVAGVTWTCCFPDRNLVYYLSGTAELYAFDLETKNADLIDENVTGLDYLWDSANMSQRKRVGISYYKNDGWYDRLVNEQESIKSASNASIYAANNIKLADMEYFTKPYRTEENAETGDQCLYLDGKDAPIDNNVLCIVR